MITLLRIVWHLILFLRLPTPKCHHFELEKQPWMLRGVDHGTDITEAKEVNYYGIVRYHRICKDCGYEQILKYTTDSLGERKDMEIATDRLISNISKSLGV